MIIMYTLSSRTWQLRMQLERSKDEHNVYVADIEYYAETGSQRYRKRIYVPDTFVQTDETMHKLAEEISLSLVFAWRYRIRNTLGVN